jgi:hypothetical protein
LIKIKKKARLVIFKEQLTDQEYDFDNFNFFHYKDSSQTQLSNKIAHNYQNEILNTPRNNEHNQILQPYQPKLLQSGQHQQLQANTTTNPYKEDLFSLSTNSLTSLNRHQTNYQNAQQQLSSNSLNDLSRPQAPFSYQMQQQQQQQNFQPVFNLANSESNGSSKSNSQNSLNSSHKSDNLQQKIQQANAAISNKLPTNSTTSTSNNLQPVSTQEFQHQLRMSKESDEINENNNLNKLKKCGDNLDYLKRYNSQKAQEFDLNAKEQATRSGDENSDEEDEYEEEDEEEDDDDDDDINNDKSECENVFGTALKDLKQNKNWQQSIIVNSSNQSTFIDNGKNSAPLSSKNALSSPRGFQQPSSESTSMYLSDTSQLPKFNYVSLLLDEYCDKNTSINTEALAFKYLKQNPSNSGVSTTSNTTTCNYESFNLNTSYFPTNPINTFLLDTQSSSSTLGVNQQQFQFYQNSFQSNEKEIKSSATPNQRLILNTNHQKNADLLPSQILSVKSKTETLNKNSKNENCKMNKNDASSADESENSEEASSSDGDGEVWLFGKPKSGPMVHNKFLDKPDTRSAQNQTNKNLQDNVKKSIPLPPLPSSQSSVKQKQRKKLQIQQKRNSTGAATNINGKQKDFSDQDEDVDRDVTTVLDIEKLKRLPKLL